MKGSQQPFVVGRRTRRGMMVVMLRPQPTPVLRGPWTVQAVVTPAQG